jgi:hypothetical protein
MAFDIRDLCLRSNAQKGETNGPDPDLRLRPQCQQAGPMASNAGKVLTYGIGIGIGCGGSPVQL